MRRIGVALFCVVGVCIATAPAEVITFEFGMTGAEEVPPVETPGFGDAVVNFDTDTLALDWTIFYDGLLGEVTAAHFHGPAPPGQNAPPVVPIPLEPGGGSLQGAATITSEQAADLLNGLWYANIHTDMFPGGEIRGQVVPEPSMLAAGTLLGLFLRRR